MGSYLSTQVVLKVEETPKVVEENSKVEETPKVVEEANKVEETPMMQQETSKLEETPKVVEVEPVAVAEHADVTKKPKSKKKKYNK